MTSTNAELIRGLAAEEATRLLAIGSPLPLESGQSLFRLGGEADRIFVVSRGRLALTLPLAIRGGQEEILIEELQPGGTVGWSGLVPPHRFTLSASAPVASEVLVFSRAALTEHFATYPAVGRAVAMNLAAIIGKRLQIFQAMWLREMQRAVDARFS